MGSKNEQKYSHMPYYYKCYDYLNGYYEKTNNIENKYNVICQWFKNGYCPYGSKCKYSHVFDKDHMENKIFPTTEEKFSNFETQLISKTENQENQMINKRSLCKKNKNFSEYYRNQDLLDLKTDIDKTKQEDFQKKSNKRLTTNDQRNFNNHHTGRLSRDIDEMNQNHYDSLFIAKTLTNRKANIGPEQQKTRQICYKFKENGYCSNGGACKYYHETINFNNLKTDELQRNVENELRDKKTSLKKQLSVSTNEGNEESITKASSSTTENFEHVASDFLLCCPSKSAKSKQYRVHLKEYVSEKRLEIVEMFYNEKIKIDLKRENVYKNDFSTFKEENEAIDNEEKLLFCQEVSFNNEIKRLNSFQVTLKNENFIKSAYDREYKRAMNRLPVYGYRTDILETLNTNNVLVLVGLTGSGKSTQIVQYLLEAGFDRSKKICCTEPRKVACVSLAKRISEEMELPEDTLVTYKVGKNNRRANNQNDEKRFEILRNAKLILMTDKILLSEYQKDNMLKNYSCILIDEAHERSIFSDLLLCELKMLVEKRKLDKHPLKLIIMSATIDYDKFSKYFDNCPIIHVSGLLYPVIVNYEKMKANYLDQAVDCIKHVIRNKLDNPGDILVFLTSFEEIIIAKKKVEKFLEESQESINYICLTLYGRMEVEDQTKVFSSYNNRTKIILSTNVAETSITIDGVKIVIDSGRAKERWFDQACNISLIKLSPISQSSAIQRKGRAGRTSNGICYRLYEESDFNQMEYMIQPEIFRLNLGLVILQLLSYNADNPLNYDLIDKPEQSLMISSLKKLTDLQFVDENMKITESGSVAVEMYQEPSISKFILEGVNLGISYEITIIAAMLSVSNILYSRGSTKEERGIGILKWSNSSGDLLSMLDMYNTYKSINPYYKKIEWCNSSSLSINAFKQAEQIFNDLWSIIKQTSYLKNSKGKLNDKDGIKKNVLEAICASMHSNLAYFNGHSNGVKVYKLVELNQEAYIHPSSSLYVLQDSDIHAELVIFSDIIRTDKLYIKNITPVTAELVKKYSNFNIENLQLNVKQEINMDTNPMIIDSLKSFNNNLIENLEAKLGCIVTLKNNSIMIEVPKAEANKSIKIVEDFIKMAKNRLIEEMYEYRPESFENVKLIVGKGLKVYAVLLNREYLRLNLFDIDIKITEEDVLKMFEKFGSVLDVRVNKAVNSRVTGYVIMNDIVSAQNAFNYFIANYNDFNIIPSASIDSNAKFGKVPFLKASWFLTPPNGKAFITFKTQDDLNIAKVALENDGFFVSRSINNPILELVLSNVTKNDSIMDEIKFKKYVSTFARVENVVFLRRPVPSSKDLILQNTLAKSLFSQFGEIDSIFILHSSMNKDGFQLKPRVDAHIKFKEYQSAISAYKSLDNTTTKFSFGLFHVSVKNREEIKVPGDVYEKFLNEIDNLKDITRTEFNCKTSVNEINEFKKKAYFVVLTGNDNEKIKQAAKLYNELLEPDVLTLPYFKYDQIRKRLNKDNYQSIFEKMFNVIILKDARCNQLKIYGKNRQKAAEELLKGLNEGSDSITLDVKSFKSIIGNSSDNLKLLKEDFRGEIKCDFKNKTITLFSKISQLRRFEAKIKELDERHCFESVLYPSASKNNNNNCNICFTSCDSPFRLLQCNHLFCFECVKAQIFNFDMTSVLECAANSCTKLFTIADIKKVIGYNSKLIDSKCHISMNNYLVNSQDYKVCKGCDELCRVEKEISEYFCERCNKNYCCKCNKQEHRGYACNDKEKELFDKYLEKYAKTCPKCSAPIEKNQGCNHITCSLCKTHFCWICRYVAEDASKMYDHLKDSHGGIE